MSVITLLTDFGTDDEYVGLMKGVILSINPSVTIVDLTHQINRQDIIQAAFTIHSGYRYFPEGTVHLIVVDPGVGTERALLVLNLENHFFIAPDNGVLTLLFNEKKVSSLNLITITPGVILGSLKCKFSYVGRMYSYLAQNQIRTRFLCRFY